MRRRDERRSHRRRRARARKTAARASFRPLSLDEFVGQQAGARQSARLHRGGAAARGEALDHVLLVRAARPRQDDAGADRRARARRRLPRDLRAR